MVKKAASGQSTTPAAKGQGKMGIVGEKQPAPEQRPTSSKTSQPSTGRSPNIMSISKPHFHNLVKYMFLITTDYTEVITSSENEPLRYWLQSFIDLIMRQARHLLNNKKNASTKEYHYEIDELNYENVADIVDKYINKQSSMDFENTDLIDLYDFIKKEFQNLFDNAGSSYERNSRYKDAVEKLKNTSYIKNVVYDYEAKTADIVCLEETKTKKKVKELNEEEAMPYKIRTALFNLKSGYRPDVAFRYAEIKQKTKSKKGDESAPQEGEETDGGPEKDAA